MKYYEHKIQYYETDKMQVTHHSNYIRFMEEARVYFLDKIGWGYDKMEKEGIISPVVSITCDYKKTTTFTDVICISINVLEISPAKLKLSYIMTVDNNIVCTASSTHCFLKDGKPINIKRQYPEFYNLMNDLSQK